MKRRLSRLAAFALTLVAVCAMVIVPASADQTMTFNKVLTMEGSSSLPAEVEFAFTITPGAASTDSAFPVSAGPAGASIDTATFAAGSNGGTQAVTVDFSGVTFPAPGVYRYIITETASNLPGFTNDENATRYLDVVVTADGSYRYNLLPSATSFDGDGNYSGTKSDGFTNTFKAHNFAFSKNVDGNVGDHNKTFEFTLNITGALPGTYTVTSSDIEGAPTTITVDAEGNYTGAFNLKHGSSFSIAGLNEGAVCAVSAKTRMAMRRHTK